jgi:hypothetical protein
MPGLHQRGVDGYAATQFAQEDGMSRTLTPSLNKT